MSSMWDKRKDIKASNPYAVKNPTVVQRVVKLEQQKKKEPATDWTKMDDRVSRLEAGFKHLRQQNVKMIDMMEMMLKRMN